MHECFDKGIHDSPPVNGLRQATSRLHTYKVATGHDRQVSIRHHRQNMASSTKYGKLDMPIIHTKAATEDDSSDIYEAATEEDNRYVYVQSNDTRLQLSTKRRRKMTAVVSPKGRQQMTTRLRLQSGDRRRQQVCLQSNDRRLQLSTKAAAEDDSSYLPKRPRGAIMFWPANFEYTYVLIQPV